MRGSFSAANGQNGRMHRRNPFPVLVGAALVPALVLFGLWKLADSQVGEAVPATTPGTVAGPSGPVGMRTPLLSTRRAPAVLSADLNGVSFAAALQPFAETLPAESCLAVSVNGEPVNATRADDLLRPASNVKLLVAAVANSVMGKDYRFTTSVKAAVGGGGVVDGDLYLVGGGDPVLSEPWWQSSGITLLPPNVITDITKLADKVKAAGVTKITGSVVGDDTRYDDERFAPTVPKQVKSQLEALPVSALEVNDTRVSPELALDRPTVASARVFAKLLKDRGIEIGGNSDEAATPDGTPEIASIESAPLPEILHEMLAQSDNLTAEMMLKEIAVQSKRPGTREEGIRIVTNTVLAWGAQPGSMALVDGSGISDENRVTCNALLTVLRHGTISDPVGKGLAVLGESGTTLEGVLDKTPAAGKLRAKTGTLTNADGVKNKPGAKTLSGYYPVEGGGQIEFVILLNGESITNKNTYRKYWEQLFTILAGYPQGPTAAVLAPSE